MNDLPKLSALRAAPAFRESDLDEQLEIYDKWSADVRSNSPLQTEEEQAQLDRWLHNQRGMIQTEYEVKNGTPVSEIVFGRAKDAVIGVGEAASNLFQSAKRGTLNTGAGVQTAVAADQFGQSRIAQAEVEAVKGLLRDDELIVDNRTNFDGELPPGSRRLEVPGSTKQLWAVPKTVSFTDQSGNPKTRPTVGAESFEKWSGGRLLTADRKREIATDAIVSAQGLANKAEQIPTAPAMKEFLEAEGFKESSKVLFNNFDSIIAHTLAESAPSFAAAIGGGAVGGPTGAFIGGGGAEFTASFRDTLIKKGKEKGYDTSTPEGLAAAMSDIGVSNDAVRVALTRSSIIGAVDAASSGLAGKISGKFMGIGAKLKGAGVEAAAGSAGGFAGEIAAQAASGQDVSVKEGLLEAFGQTGQSVVQSGVAVAQDIDSIRNQNQEATGETVETNQQAPVEPRLEQEQPQAVATTEPEPTTEPEQTLEEVESRLAEIESENGPRIVDGVLQRRVPEEERELLRQFHELNDNKTETSANGGLTQEAEISSSETINNSQESNAQATIPEKNNQAQEEILDEQANRELQEADQFQHSLQEEPIEDGLTSEERIKLQRESEEESLGQLREGTFTLDEAIDEIGGLISPSKSREASEEFRSAMQESGERKGNSRIGAFKNTGNEYDEAVQQLREYGFDFDSVSDLEEAYIRQRRGETQFGVPRGNEIVPQFSKPKAIDSGKVGKVVFEGSKGRSESAQAAIDIAKQNSGVSEITSNEDAIRVVQDLAVQANNATDPETKLELWDVLEEAGAQVQGRPGETTTDAFDREMVIEEPKIIIHDGKGELEIASGRTELVTDDDYDLDSVVESIDQIVDLDEMADNQDTLTLEEKEYQDSILATIQDLEDAKNLAEQQPPSKEVANSRKPRKENPEEQSEFQKISEGVISPELAEESFLRIADATIKGIGKVQGLDDTQVAADLEVLQKDLKSLEPQEAVNRLAEVALDMMLGSPQHDSLSKFYKQKGEWNDQAKKRFQGHFNSYLRDGREPPNSTTKIRRAFQHLGKLWKSLYSKMSNFVPSRVRGELDSLIQVGAEVQEPSIDTDRARLLNKRRRDRRDRRTDDQIKAERAEELKQNPPRVADSATRFDRVPNDPNVESRVAIKFLQDELRDTNSEQRKAEIRKEIAGIRAGKVKPSFAKPRSQKRADEKKKPAKKQAEDRRKRATSTTPGRSAGGAGVFDINLDDFQDQVPPREIQDTDDLFAINNVEEEFALVGEQTTETEFVEPDSRTQQDIDQEQGQEDLFNGQNNGTFTLDLSNPETLADVVAAIYSEEIGTDPTKLDSIGKSMGSLLAGLSELSGNSDSITVLGKDKADTYRRAKELLQSKLLNQNARITPALQSQINQIEKLANGEVEPVNSEPDSGKGKLRKLANQMPGAKVYFGEVLKTVKSADVRFDKPNRNVEVNISGLDLSELSQFSKMDVLGGIGVAATASKNPNRPDGVEDFLLIIKSGGAKYGIAGYVNGDSLFIEEMSGSNRGEQSRATSIEALGQLITKAQELGINQINTYAAEGEYPGYTATGYSTWANIGFESTANFLGGYFADSKDPEVKRMLELGGGVNDFKLIKLTSTREGRRLWKKHGLDYNASFDLTPGSDSLKRFDAVLKALTRTSTDESRQLYQEARGFFDQATEVIGVLPNANESTFIHEIGHLIRHRLQGTEHGNALDSYYDNWEAGLNDNQVLVRLNNFGVDLSNLTNDQARAVLKEEAFARHVERYMRDGKAPKGASKGLRGALKVVADMMKGVYRRLAQGHPLYGNIPDATRKVLDEMMLAGDRRLNNEIEPRAELFGSNPPQQSLIDRAFDRTGNADVLNRQLGGEQTQGETEGFSLAVSMQRLAEDIAGNLSDSEIPGRIRDFVDSLDNRALAAVERAVSNADDIPSFMLDFRQRISRKGLRALRNALREHVSNESAADRRENIRKDLSGGKQTIGSIAAEETHRRRKDRKRGRDDLLLQSDPVPGIADIQSAFNINNDIDEIWEILLNNENIDKSIRDAKEDLQDFPSEEGQQFLNVLEALRPSIKNWQKWYDDFVENSNLEDPDSAAFALTKNSILNRSLSPLIDVQKYKDFINNAINSGSGFLSHESPDASPEIRKQLGDLIPRTIQENRQLAFDETAAVDNSPLGDLVWEAVNLAIDSGAEFENVYNAVLKSDYPLASAEVAKVRDEIRDFNNEEIFFEDENGIKNPDYERINRNSDQLWDGIQEVYDYLDIAIQDTMLKHSDQLERSVLEDNGSLLLQRDSDTFRDDQQNDRSNPGNLGRAILGERAENGLEYARSRTDERRDSEAQSLIQESQRDGEIESVEDFGLTEDDFLEIGGEHGVRIFGGRVYKYTGVDKSDELGNPQPLDKYGRAMALNEDGDTLPFFTDPDTPGGYLSRWAWHNFLFDDDVRVEAVTADGKIQISQPKVTPLIAKEDAEENITENTITEEELVKWLEDNGWELDYGADEGLNGRIFIHPETGVYATDVKAMNFGKREDGSIYPIDLILMPSRELFPPSGDLSQPLLLQTDKSKAARNFSRKDAAFAWVRRNFTSRGDLPDGSFQAKMKGQGLQNKIRKEAEHNLERLETKISQISGFAWNPKRKKEQQRLLDEANEALVGARSIGSLHSKLQPIVRDIRGHIDRLSDLLIQEGVVAGELELIVDANRGTYLNRSYRIFDAGDEWRGKIPEDVKNRAEGLLRNQSPREPGETQEAYDSRIAGHLTELIYGRGADSPAEFLAKSGMGRKDLSVFIGRKDIPAEIRALWGEYTEAHQNYARTAFKQASLISNHNFLKDVKDDGLGVYLFESPQDEFGVPIVAEGNKSLEPMDGLYTTPEIAAAFNAIKPGELPKWARTLLTLNGTAKYSKTVLNPITHVRNYVSNTIVMVANGHLPMSLLSDAAPMRVLAGELFSGRLLDLVEKGGFRTKDWRDQYRRYVELGVLEDGVNGQELFEVMKDSLIGDPTLAEFSDNRMKKIISKANKVPQKLYQAEDGFWKIIAFEKERNRYAKAFPNMTSEQLDRKAADIIRNTMPTYSLIPNAIQAFRRFPGLAPFVSFASEIFRTNFHIIKLAREELHNPATRHIGLQRYAGLITAHLIPVMAVAAMRVFSGTSEEDDEQIRELTAPWDATGQLAFLGENNDGNPRFINMSYSDPYSMIKRGVQGYKTGVDNEEPYPVALGQFFFELLSPFAQEEIGTQAIIDISRNTKSATGSPVYNASDSKAKIGMDVAGHVWKSVEPGFMGSGRRILSALGGKRGASGKAYNLNDEIIALLSGQRIVTVDPVNNISFSAKTFIKERNDTSWIFTSVAGNRGTVSDREIRSAYNRANSQKQKMMTKFRRKYNAAVRFSDMKSVDESVRSSGMSEATLNLLKTDKATEEVTFTDSLLNRMDAIPGRRAQVENALGINLTPKFTKAEVDWINSDPTRKEDFADARSENYAARLGGFKRRAEKEVAKREILRRFGVKKGSQVQYPKNAEGKPAYRWSIEEMREFLNRR